MTYCQEADKENVGPKKNDSQLNYAACISMYDVW